ncbi:MAG: transcriptional activator RfaH [Proteobacteria bacterium]|nr:transcriptional activator RfaH [Pseudomonadota bacterium]
MDFSTADDAAWIAVSAHPNREHTAEMHLRNQGYEVYVPVLRKQIRHARQVREVLRPLFPGYLFVCLTHSTMRWRPILSTVGVRSVVSMGEAPCTVSSAFIDELKSRETNGVIVRSAAAPKVGDTIRVAYGALDGLAGKIIALSENDRIVVLMNLLNRPVRVTVPGALLSVA